MNTAIQRLGKVAFYGGVLATSLAVPFFFIPTNETEIHLWILGSALALSVLADFAFSRAFSDATDVMKIKELSGARFDTVMDRLLRLKRNLTAWWILCVVLKAILLIDTIVLKVKPEVFPGHAFIVYLGYASVGILLPSTVFFVLLCVFSAHAQEDARRAIRDTLSAQKTQRELLTGIQEIDQGNHYGFYKRTPRPS